MSQVVLNGRTYLDPKSPCCKDCGLALEAKVLETLRNKDLNSVTKLMAKCKTDHQLRSEIIDGKDISSGTAVPQFPMGEVFKGHRIIHETVGETHFVTEDIFTDEVAGGLTFEGIPQDRPEHKISEFYTSEGQLLEGVAMQPGSIPPGMVHHKVLTRYQTFADQVEEVINRNQLLLPSHLRSQFASSRDCHLDNMPHQTRLDSAPQLLSWIEWKSFMTEQNEAIKKAAQLRRDKVAASAGPSSAQPQRKLVGFGRLGEVAASAVDEVPSQAVAVPKRKGKKRRVLAPSKGEESRSSTGQKLRRSLSVDSRGGDEGPQRRKPHGKGGKGMRRRAEKERAAMMVDVGGGKSEDEDQEKTEQEKDAEGREYWHKPKEMDLLFMKQCQLGVNHTRVIAPVGALVHSGFSFLHFLHSLIFASILSWLYSFCST